jgi:fructose-bisphosphate aldolase class II
MPLISMREMLDHAAENGYGIPAFNVNNLEQVQAVMSAADEVGAPVSCKPALAPASTPVSPSSST